MFLVESADATLQMMMENVTVHRSIAALTVHLSHRSPALRGRLAVCLHALVVARTAEIAHNKEFDALKNALGKLVNERVPEARSHSRDAIRFLINNKVVSRATIESAVSGDQLDRILKDPYTPAVVGETMSMLSSMSRSRPGDVSSSSSSFQLQRGGSSNDMNSPAPKRVQSGRRPNGHGGEGSAAPSPMTRGSPHVDGSGGVFTPQRASAGRRRRSPDAGAGAMRGVDAHDPHLDSYGAAYINEGTPLMTPRFDDAADYSSGSIGASSSNGKKDSGPMRYSLPTVPNSPKPSSHALVSSSFNTGSGKQSPLRRPFQTKTGSTNASGSGSSGSSNSAAAASAVAAAAKRAMENDPELASLQDKLAATAVKAWMERKEAMTVLTTLMINHYDVLRDAGKLAVCIDNMLDRLQDGSAKARLFIDVFFIRLYILNDLSFYFNIFPQVHMHALACLERINDEEPFVLQHNLMNIIAPALLASAGSTNKCVPIHLLMRLSLVMYE